jgi:hypothetical protein
MHPRTRGCGWSLRDGVRAVLEPFKLEQHQHFYLHGSLIVNVIWGDVRLETLLSIAGVCEHVVRQHGRLSSVVVVRGDYGIELSPELRRAGANLVTKFDKHQIGQALVLEDEGFRASMARSAITAVNLLARSRTRQRVFKDAHEATLWVCSDEQQPADIRSEARNIAGAVRQLLAGQPT